MTGAQVLDYRFPDETEGIELVNRRIAQIQQLRARSRQLAAAHNADRTVTSADELSLAQFRLYEAKFMLDRLVARLKHLQRVRKRLLSASALPYDARATGR